MKARRHQGTSMDTSALEAAKKKNPDVAEIPAQIQGAYKAAEQSKINV